MKKKIIAALYVHFKSNIYEWLLLILSIAFVINMITGVIWPRDPQQF